jgi:hypothetical protein
MKSPWKFLVQLTSRGRPAKTPAASIEHDAEATAVQSEVQQTSILPLSSTDIPNETDGHLDMTSVVSLPGDAEDVQLPVRDEISRSNTEALALMRQNAISEKSPRISQTKRPAHAKRARATMDAKSVVTTSKDHSPHTPLRPETVFDEAVSLDEEIKQLRNQLAQKLYLQNVQLKKMLQRFDV